MIVIRTASLALAVLLCWSASAIALDPDTLLQQIDRKLTPVSYESYRKIINVEPDGSKREYTLYMVKKGEDMVASVFLEPSSDKGRATLRLGDNMWLHIPNVGKPVRITSLQSVTGGVFNNADILRLDYATEYRAESLEEQGEAYLLKLKARTDAVAYDRLEMRVDKALQTPQEVKCIAASGMLIKTLYFKNTKDFGEGLVRPAVIETDSPLYKGYRSIMIFAKVQAREFADEVFTLNNLPRVDLLRR
ncbi:outer membrane lipoprotein-sorting protein [Megalodesulfovibrio paquesii]